MKKHVLALMAAATLAVSANAMAGGDIAKGKAKATTVCAACHGADGRGKTPMYPNLHGQKEAYLVKQLKAFKDGSRKDPIMNGMAKPLSDDDINNVAAYFSSLK